MKKEAYRSALAYLPINNPTLEDVMAVCPHLTREQAVVILKTKPGLICCPPHKVRGLYHMISLSEEYTTLDTHQYHPSCLSTLGADKLPTKPDPDGGMRYITEATEFAEKNWGSELVENAWDNILALHIHDPTGELQLKYSLMVCLSRNWVSIIHDQTKPQSVLIDEAIVEMTLDKVIAAELWEARGRYYATGSNCAYCGHGLDLTECKGCGHTFERDISRLEGWQIPLSVKMVKFLKANGHVFKKDPAIAQQKEAETTPN